MMNKNTFLLLAIFMVAVAWLIPACVPENEGNVTPRADLVFTIKDESGNLIPDAYLAALAIESGSEWITTDRDYERFPGLRSKVL